LSLRLTLQLSLELLEVAFRLGRSPPLCRLLVPGFTLLLLGARGHLSRFSFAFSRAFLGRLHRLLGKLGADPPAEALSDETKDPHVLDLTGEHFIPCLGRRLRARFVPA